MKLLIVGPNSYIAKHFTEHTVQTHPDWIIDKLSVREDHWKTYDYSGYDSVLYFAAVVHKKETPELLPEYQRLNCDIPAEIAQMLRDQNRNQNAIPQFIYLSTMAVFGLEGRVGQIVTIDKSTPTLPKSAYGKSKLSAEQALSELASDGPLNVATFRPPMVFGPDCPGNYQTLKKFVLKFHVFPTTQNQRSMIHIDTLCSKLLHCVETRQDGIFHPQEPKYICTKDMAQDIADKAGTKLFLCPLLNPFVHLGGKLHPAFHKVWGSLIYDKNLK
ncbi:MAG: NAD-dependent epimerase/dehydratase family protein [Firmicutes bacterium]|nr:NAD-dependent epimerase/dehydratase family protein [Bacillota bacterium]